jgi:hypothetical protein
VGQNTHLYFLKMIYNTLVCLSKKYITQKIEIDFDKEVKDISRTTTTFQNGYDEETGKGDGGGERHILRVFLVREGGDECSVLLHYDEGCVRTGGGGRKEVLL